MNACTPKLADGWFQTRVAEIPRNRRCRLEMWFSSYAMHTIIDFFAIFQLLNCMQSFRLAVQRLSFFSFSKKPSVHSLINTAVLVLAGYKILCLIPLTDNRLGVGSHGDVDDNGDSLIIILTKSNQSMTASDI